MRVLLARPPRRDASDAGLPVPPLGLAYLAAVMRDAGRPVTLIDAYALGWSWDRFVREVATIRPDVLGLGAMTPVVDVAWRAAELCRPHVGRVVLGGPHPTAVGADALEEHPAIDHAVVGEGEEILLPYLDWVESGERKDPPPGVHARGRPFAAHRPRRAITDIPWPARDLLPRGGYRYLMATRPGFATMISSRGCPFRCSFCDKGVSGSAWRARPAEDVVDELQHLERDLGIGFVNFYDDNFTLKRGRVAAICEEILRRGLRLEWKCEGRVDGVDEELLRLMRRAGCRVVAYGVESANPDTLSMLRKDIDPDEVERAFAATKAAGLRSVAYLILGAPGEGADGVRETLRFVQRIGADYAQFSSLVALPGTPLFAQYSHADADVRNPVDGDLRRKTVTDLAPDALAALMRQAWRGFYLRPRPLARLARDAVASGAGAEAARLGVAMARWSMQGRGWHPDERWRWRAARG